MAFLLLCLRYFPFASLKMKYCLFLFFIFSYTASTVSAVTYKLPQYEYDALEDLYVSTGGESWTWLTPYSTNGYPWSFSSTNPQNPCSSSQRWQGVSCTNTCQNSQCNVRSIVLSANNMFGTLPSTLGNFTKLTELSLTENHITGTVPMSLARLLKLNSLYLSTNVLSGSIPDQLFASMNSLSIVDLSGNYFTGPLPSVYSSDYLQQLNLGNNSFSGTLSSDFRDIVSLRYFYANYNHLTGTIPNSFANLTNLMILVLNNNNFTGTIPSGINSMNKLFELQLNYNRLNGTIPDVDQMSNIFSIELGNNELTGTIPDFSNLQNLAYLFLGFNQLSGPLPTKWDMLPQLSYVILANNHIRGTLPPSMCNLTSLTLLNLVFNEISGSIPLCFSELSSLTDLIMSKNRLTGVIPYQVGSWPQMEILALSYNHMNGQLPSFYGMNELTQLALCNNMFTGTIPSSFSFLTNLTDLVLFENELHGPIPETLENLLYLLTLEVNNNMLDGTIPETVGYIERLQTVNLYNNFLFGSLPPGLGYLTFLDNFNANSNLISGSIPVELGNLLYLGLLDLSNCLLTGTIPASFSNLVQMQYLNLANNQMEGNIDALSHMIHCIQLYLSNNSFSGEISALVPLSSNLRLLGLSSNHFSGTITPGLFGPNSSLDYVYLNDNKFSGTIPESIFKTPEITAVVLSSNCLSGTIPVSICDAATLTGLSLFGLHSSSTCISHAISFIKNSGVIIKNGVHGHIPTCLFQLPALAVLELGGNSFSGALPNIEVTSSLNTLVLANNEFSGTIPLSFYTNNNISYFDLSLNRFQGTIPSNAFNVVELNTSYSVVKLNVNQLSGKLPHSLLGLVAGNVDVLDGNMFSCKPDRSDLPSNDPNNKSYNCGSDDTNYALITFAVVLCCACVLVSITKAYGILQLWYGSFQGTNATDDVNCHHLDLKCISILQRFNLLSMMYIIVGGSVLYGILACFYASYTERYVWTLSGIYLQGTVPAVLLMLFFLAFIVVANIAIQQLHHYRTDSLPEQNTTSIPTIHIRGWDHVAILANITIVLFVNGLYVSAVQSDYYAGELMAISFCIGVFKWGWNQVLLLGSEITGFSDNAIVSLFLFNNLIAPFAAELFVSSNCFLYIVSEAPQLSYVVEELSCTFFKTAFLTATTCSVEFIYGYVKTPFHYSYQCSFSLISNYAYVFCFRYILSGIVEPLVFWLIHYLSPEKKTFIDIILPQLWKIRLNNGENVIHEFEKDLEKLETAVQRGQIRQKWVTKVITDLAMLMCFGTLFPPLAFIIGISILKDCIDLKLSLGRMKMVFEEALKQAATTTDANVTELQKRLTDLRIYVQRDISQSIGNQFRVILLAIPVLSAMIWSFILFDTLAAETGASGAIWIVVFTMLLPIVIYFGVIWYDQFSRNVSKVDATDDSHFITPVSNPIISSNQSHSRPVFEKNATSKNNIEIEMTDMNNQ